MCKSKMATNASDPVSTRPTHSPQTRRTRSTPSPRNPPTLSYPSTSTSTSTTADYTAAASSSSHTKPFSTSTTSSRTSLSSLRGSISENPHIYSFSEIRSATNNFLLKKYSSSPTNCWRCDLRGKDVIIFQRKFRRKLEMQNLRERLSVICRSHHNSIIKLLGASISDDYIYLVYEYINGANLSDCLRNSKNPEFTVLSTWMSRMQIATDLAHGLDYIHNTTGLSLNLVHNHIKSSSIIVTEPSLNAKICHFGTAQLCGETDDSERKKVSDSKKESEISEIVEIEPSLTRSSSRNMQFEGVRGYMSPEFRATGVPMQKSDVYALGVVILELLSGEEPLKYKYDKTRGEFTRTSVIDTARLAMDGGEEGEREGRLRKWMDRRLRDSFPVDVAENVTRVALECVDVDPDKRPDMGRVSRKISKLYLASQKWSDNIKLPVGISLSVGPRS
ncbi:Protein kinase superfamily protein [Melia azedarach]|uniref:Protein kinase superfamily protein n=1 Tax=Melia azedarach TaxID=155640 RepID=A0ACC1YN07_MELAZ|nr:Protein kinase superfamily protein [Melia azedarach]